MGSFYTKEDDTYYYVTGDDLKRIGKEFALGFSVSPVFEGPENKKKIILLHKHGTVESVEKWYNTSTAKILAAGVPSFTEDLKMIVSSEVDTAEINLMLANIDYLSAWLKKNNVKV